MKLSEAKVVKIGECNDLVLLEKMMDALACTAKRLHEEKNVGELIDCNVDYLKLKTRIEELGGEVKISFDLPKES